MQINGTLLVPQFPAYDDMQTIILNEKLPSTCSRSTKQFQWNHSLKKYLSYLLEGRIETEKEKLILWQQFPPKLLVLVWIVVQWIQFCQNPLCKRPTLLVIQDCGSLDFQISHFQIPILRISCPLDLLKKNGHCWKYRTRITQFICDHKVCKGHLSFIFDFRVEMDSILPDLQRAVQDCGRLHSNLIEKLFPKEIKLFWGLQRLFYNCWISAINICHC